MDYPTDNFPPPPLLPVLNFPPPEIDYARLSELVVDRVVQGVAGQLTQVVAAQNHPNPAAELTANSKKRRVCCGVLQRVITKIMLSGLNVEKVDHIGSARQPGPDNVDDDNEAPWVIYWDKPPNHPDNREVVAKWIMEVINSDDTKRLLREGKITEAQYTEDFVRSLLIHSFDAARKAKKINKDESGERMERVKVSKDKSKRKQRRKDLCANRRDAAKNRLWQGKPIPKEFFEPAYHSDSEADPTPDLSRMEKAVNPERYAEARNGADYEMLTPGWRSDKMTRLFRWLDKEHKKDTNNRPQGSRWYCDVNRAWDENDIPDGAPRCMISDEAWNNSMDDAKRQLARPSPPGW
ncbi:hypothetical protein FS749_006294 [Ceratobasidium sp. UAMH 11750]|nr:hypothetical protein FS749_006294 [Ceratobasidium sp. UAMH 11750]